ncbi:MAG: glycosyltransferase family 9 protein [Chloroflexia bacterium]
MLLVGGPEEREAAQAVGALGRAYGGARGTHRRADAGRAALASATCSSGLDAGVMHVAAAVGVPVVSLRGPTNEAAWGPLVSPGGDTAVCLRAPDRPTPWVYVGRSMGDVRRPSDLGSLDPCVVAEAALNILKEVDR